MATIRCPIINTARLKPIRQQVNKVIMTITDGGFVSLEILGHLNNQPDGPEIAKELFHVSPDGIRVQVYQNIEGVAAIDGCPVSSQPDRVFIYPDLPEKQWRMYQHAYKFVDIIKSKTAKVILVTDLAKCLLMENLPVQNFQATFNDEVIVLLTESKMVITDADGCIKTFDYQSINSCDDPSLLKKIEYTKECHLQCLDLQESVNKLQCKDVNKELFPLSVGTKTAPFKLSPQNNSSINIFGNRRFPHKVPAISRENVPIDNQNSLLTVKTVTQGNNGNFTCCCNYNTYSHLNQAKDHLEQNQGYDCSVPMNPDVKCLVKPWQESCLINCTPPCKNVSQNMLSSKDGCEHTNVNYHRPETLCHAGATSLPTANCDIYSHASDAASAYQPYIYATPKKSFPAAYHPHYHSIDSLRHSQPHNVNKKNSLTMGTVVDEQELNSVKRHLFYNQAFVDPLITPSPLPGICQYDLPEICPTPSLELSFCIEPSNPSLHFETNSKSKTCQEYDISCTLHQCHISDVSAPNQVKKSSTEVTDLNSRPAVSDFADTIKFQPPNSLVRSFSQSPQSEVQDFKKRLLDVPSPTKTISCHLVSMPMDTADAAASSSSTCSQQPLHISYTSSSGQASRSSSCCHSNQSIQEKLNEQDYSGIKKGQYRPTSPQKGFLMKRPEKSQRDLSRPLQNSLDMSVSSYYSDSPSSSPSSGCDPIRQVFVPYTGWASLYATGAVWILYNDGTQLGIKSTEATMTYIDQDGSQKRYKNSDVIPEIIKIKLEKLPMIVGMLMKSPPISSILY